MTLVDVPPPITLVPPKNMATIQSKKKGRWDDELYRPDPPQEKGCHSLPRSPDVRPSAGSSSLGEATGDRVGGAGAIDRANRSGHAVESMIDRYLVESSTIGRDQAAHA